MQKSISLSFLLLSSWLVGYCRGQALADVESLSQHRYALLIGVDRYDDQSIGTLTDPVNDVTQLKLALVESAHFDDVTVLADDGNPTHLPTRTNILKALYKIRTSVPDDGDALLLVMFSGHGMMDKGGGFVLPRDAASSSDTGLLTDTSLSVSLLLRSMAGTKAKQTILIMDACRNFVSSSHAVGEGQPLTREFENQFDFRTFNKDASGSLVLFGTGIGDKAWVNGSTKLGYFTEVLIQAIRGAKTNADGNVTLANLIEYIQTEVPRRVSENEDQKIQRPEYLLSGFRPEKIVISRHAGGASSTQESSPQAQVIGTAITPQILADKVRWYTQRHFNPDVDDFKNKSSHSLWLDLSPELLSQVKSATYILHHKSFVHPMYSLPDNSKHLAVRFTAYGCVDFATVVVELSNGSSVSADFNECKKHQDDQPAPN